jgi:hypothetical protein
MELVSFAMRSTGMSEILSFGLMHTLKLIKVIITIIAFVSVSQNFSWGKGKSSGNPRYEPMRFV